MEKKYSFEGNVLSDPQLDSITAAGFDPKVLAEITRQAREAMRDGAPAEWGRWWGEASDTQKSAIW